MRVGISTATFFNKCNLEDTPLYMRNFGADLCEVFFNTFSEYRPEFVNLLHERIKDAGIEVYSIHPMGTQFEPQLFSLHPRQKSDAEELFKNVLQAGQKMGAKCYVLHGPASLNGAVKNVQIDRVGAVATRLCDIAADYGLEIAWENVSWCLFSNPEYAYDLKERAKKLRFTLDIKQAARSGYAPGDFIKAMGDRLINVHICDYSLRGGSIHTLLPGRGECDLAALRSELENAGYNGPAFMELYSDLYESFDELQEGFEYTKNELL